MTIAIYGLYDPRDGACRYVGKTNGPLAQRLRVHISDARRRKHSVRRFSWVLSLDALGLAPEIRLLETVSEAWQAAEKRWIAKFRADGADLVNTTDGGDGCDGMRHSEETKAKIRLSAKLISPEVHARRGAAVRLAYQNPETRERLSAALRKSHSRPEVRARLSEINKRIWNTPEARARRSKMLRGRVFTPEWRAKISASRKGQKLSPERVAQLVALHTGRKRSAETRAKMSEAAKRREAAKRCGE